jgi:16S rRNA (adenine1518-N6/adenine1519-N6)-dimethyltransferase
MSKRKLLGQHMLIDNDILHTIADYAELDRNDIVFEIGTGNGNLTAELCKRAKRVISCEVDKELHKEAQNMLGKYNNLRLVNGDGFKTNHDFDVFVSNLPYSKSRTAVEWLAERDFDRAIVMVQKEFATKLLANNGNNYRAVSALAQYCFDMEQVMQVGKNSFYPKPKVDSVLLKITKKRRVSRDVIRALKLLFSFRGKKLSGVARKLGINESLNDKRIERLSPEEAVRLAEIIARERLLQTI